MNLGYLSLVHELLGKMYNVAYQLTDDSAYTNEDAAKSILIVAKQMEELTEYFNIQIK